MMFAAAALEAVAGTTASGVSALTSASGFGAAELAGGGTAAGFNAATGGSLFSALGSTSTWGSILSGGATVASMLQTKRGGEEKAFALEMQASDAETEVQVEKVKGTERQTSIKRALLEAIGERDAATAASGVDVSFGTPVIAREEARKDSERALSTDENTEKLRISRLRERATWLRSMAAQARYGALGRAAGLGLEGGAKFFMRG